MSYKAAPTLAPSTQTATESFKGTVLLNFNKIANSMISSAVSSAGVTPKVNIGAITKLITETVRPITSTWEGGWSNHPNDSGGATMRGVILSTFRATFNNIFKSTDIQPVEAAANKLETSLMGWRSNDQLGQQLLYSLLKDEKIASLWTIYFFCSQTNRYPIAIATEDAYLGFLLYDFCWGSGPGMYKSNGVDDLAREYGWKANTGFAKFIVGLGDKTPEFATKLLQKRLNFLLTISKPGTKNAVFRKGWLNRFINGRNSNIDALALINEDFNLNAKGQYNFTQAEKEHLQKKAAIYKTVSLNFPNL
jgi:hypothetical protein